MCVPKPNKATRSVTACEPTFMFLCSTLDPTDKVAGVVTTVRRWTRCVEYQDQVRGVVPIPPKKPARFVCGRSETGVLAHGGSWLAEGFVGNQDAIVSCCSDRKRGQGGDFRISRARGS